MIPFLQFLNPEDPEAARYSIQQRMRRPEAVPVLVQMLQAESTSVRDSLVQTLALVDGPQATNALAQRALFDLAEEVRAAAIQQLAQRPREQFRPLLLEGLRYPWPAVADHAAAALVGTNDKDAIPALIDMLDQPDPQALQRDENNWWTVRELVRVNHLRNCYLCHAPSLATSDPIRGLVPIPGSPIPIEYYERSQGDFVRADVTYLRQDFSVMHTVEDHGVWPERQRFDYFVRTREATADEVAALLTAADVQAPQSYPQREAVLLALRKLTGIDTGESAVD